MSFLWKPLDSLPAFYPPSAFPVCRRIYPFLPAGCRSDPLALFFCMLSRWCFFRASSPSLSSLLYGRDVDGFSVSEFPFISLLFVTPFLFCPVGLGHIRSRGSLLLSVVLRISGLEGHARSFCVLFLPFFQNRR